MSVRSSPGPGFTRGCCLYLQWPWQGQVHPGRLQSLCRTLSLEGLAQNEEVSGGQVPRGYPRQEVPVGSGDVSVYPGLVGSCVCLSSSTYRPVCSRMLTFLAVIGSGTQWACVQTGELRPKRGLVAGGYEGVLAGFLEQALALRDPLGRRVQYTAGFSGCTAKVWIHL
jgi:hypothetical protein